MTWSQYDSDGNLKDIGATGATGAAGAAGATGPAGQSGSGIITDDPWIDEFIQKGSINLANEVYGNLPVGNLNGGSGAVAGTYWRGDGIWAPIGSTGSGPDGPTPDPTQDTGSPELFLMPDSATSVNGNVLGTATAGTSQVSDVDGPWVRHTGSVDGTIVQYRTSNTQVMPDANVTFWSRIRTGGDITNIRIWLGFCSGAFTNVDTFAANGIAIRYSTVAGDGGWVGVCRSVATGLQSVTATITGIAINTKYNINITVSGNGTLVTFTVNGNQQTLATNIPTGVMHLFGTAVVRVSTANKILDVKYIKLWR